MIKIRLEDQTIVSHEIITFSGGEPCIKFSNESRFLIKDNPWITLDCRIQSFNDVGELLCLVDSIKRLHNDFVTLKLRIPYWPGARQDRISNLGEHLTCKIYADIINALKCNTIEICDPHSDVTPALLNNCSLYPVEDIIEQAIQDCKPDFIISPDAGATKRIEKYMQMLSCDLPVIQCLKKRDTRSGKLSGFQICGGPEWSQPVPAKMLMIDDIGENCGTHMGLAKEFEDWHPKNELYLYITHAILPKGKENLNNLFQYFKKVYTTDSFINNLSPSERFIVYPLY